MNRTSKFGLIAAIAAISTFAIYDVAHSKMLASQGVHILNNDNVAYTTDPAGCVGVQWPASVAPGMDSVSANEVKVTGTTSSTNCQTTYTSTADKSKTCVVEIQLSPDGKSVATIQGTGSNNGCKTTSGMRSVILAAS